MRGLTKPLRDANRFLFQKLRHHGDFKFSELTNCDEILVDKTDKIEFIALSRHTNRARNWAFGPYGDQSVRQ
jgi:hypothetical protein